MVSSSDDESVDYDNAARVLEQLVNRGANFVADEGRTHAFASSPAVETANEDYILETVFSFSGVPSSQSRTAVLDSSTLRSTGYSEATSSRDLSSSSQSGSRARSEPSLLAANAPDIAPIDSSRFSRNRLWQCKRCTLVQSSYGNDFCEACKWNPEQEERQ